MKKITACLLLIRSFYLYALDIPDPNGAVISYCSIGDSYTVATNMAGAADYRDVRIIFAADKTFRISNSASGTVKSMKEGFWTYDSGTGEIELKVTKRLIPIHYGKYAVAASSANWEYNETLAEFANEIETFEWSVLYADLYFFKNDFSSNYSEWYKKGPSSLTPFVKSTFFNLGYISGMYEIDPDIVGNILTFDKSIKLNIATGNGSYIVGNKGKAVLTNAAYSSLLEEPNDKWAYHPVYIIDDNPQSAWFEGETGSGIGESVELRFTNLSAVDSLGINPGWMSSYYFNKNNRLKKIILIVNGEEYAVSLPDKMEEYIFKLPGAVNIELLKISISEVYATEK